MSEIEPDGQPLEEDQQDSPSVAGRPPSGTAERPKSAKTPSRQGTPQRPSSGKPKTPSPAPQETVLGGEPGKISPNGGGSKRGSIQSNGPRGGSQAGSRPGSVAGSVRGSVTGGSPLPPPDLAVTGQPSSRPSSKASDKSPGSRISPKAQSPLVPQSPQPLSPTQPLSPKPQSPTGEGPLEGQETPQAASPAPEESPHSPQLEDTLEEPQSPTAAATSEPETEVQPAYNVPRTPTGFSTTFNAEPSTTGTEPSAAQAAATSSILPLESPTAAFQFSAGGGGGGGGGGDDGGGGGGTPGGPIDAVSGRENEATPISQREESELVVLDPDHPLMKRFQERLHKHLTQHDERKTLELRDLVEDLKRKKREREELGVELLGVQQELAKQQMLLEGIQDNFSSTQKTRVEKDQYLSELRSAYRNAQSQLGVELKKASDLQQEMETLALKVLFMKNAQTDVGADVNLMKRIVEKGEAERARVEAEKQRQDLFVDRLVERIDRLREEVSLLEAQLVAAQEETREAVAGANEARGEIDTIDVEKKQLFNHWNSSLIGMRRRDEAYAALQHALHEQAQAALSLDTEIDGFKRGIAREQEQNEKLMLILRRGEQEVSTLRKQLAGTAAKHEQLKQDYGAYSRTLHETESQLGRVSNERKLKAHEADGLRRQIEREHAEKVRLEDQIMEQIRSRMTLAKAAQYTDKIQGRLRGRTKELEAQIVEAENAIAQESLEVSNVRSRVEKLQQISRALFDELRTKGDIIARSQTEISKRVILIERKQDQIDQLNKKLETLVQAAGGEELGPLEVHIKQLDKSIVSCGDVIGELQQQWLREQQELVHLLRANEAAVANLDRQRKEFIILTQKRLRIDNQIEHQRAESRELDHNIARLRNDLEKLNGLLFKESDRKELIAQDTALLETDFVLRLKELEKESIGMAEKVEAIRAEKQVLLRDLVEAERQIMLWEKRTQLAVETRNAVDREIGQGEIRAMKNEIHRMEVRLGQLLRQQEKLMVEMEKGVSRRETIFTRGEAQKQMRNNMGRPGVLTRGAVHQQIADLRRRVRAAGDEARAIDAQIQTLTERQREVASLLDEKRANSTSLARSIESLDAQIAALVEQRERLRVEMLSKQRRVKYLTQLKEGKYMRYTRNAAHLEVEAARQTERMHAVALVLDRLQRERPLLQTDLRPVTQLLGARIAASASAPPSATAFGDSGRE